MFGDPERRRLLVVDDEETMRLVMSRFLQTRGYEVEVAASAQEALQVLANVRCTAMICDIRMPGMSGVELIPRALEIDPDLAVMMLTAVTDSAVAAESLSRGAGEYLMKPVELGELQVALERVLNRRSITIERRDVERLIADEVDRQTSALQHDRAEAYSRSIESLSLGVVLAESKDPYFSGTTARVAAISGAIADVLLQDTETRDHVATAAKLHDVGRLALRDQLLHKPGPLTSEEYERVKSHVRLGLEVLSPMIFLGSVLEFIEDHHERWDGQGYPNGRAGDRISIGGRILSVADAFVSLTSKRAYRAPVTAEEALTRMARQASSQFDPDVSSALTVIVTERHVFGLTADYSP
jgi:response regulator RpfG family c-di-GMP phosphodiesterase